MKRIALFCNAGMSTSLLVNKMRIAAKEQQIEVEINAYSANTIDEHKEDIHVALLGPQVRYLLSGAKKALEPKGVAVAIIDSRDYGMVRGDNVLQQALELLNER